MHRAAAAMIVRVCRDESHQILYDQNLIVNLFQILILLGEMNR